VSHRGQRFYIKFSEIDFSQKKEVQTRRRRRLLGNDPEPPIGDPEIRCTWGDTHGKSGKTRAFGSSSNTKHTISHWAINRWGPIVDSQGSGNRLVLDFVRCGIYDRREEECEDDDDCQEMTEAGAYTRPLLSPT
jgi:hypothetical protein